MAHSVAGQLTDKRPSLIGLFAGESVWTYAALLGVLMKGHAYVPLNPKYPAGRLNQIVSACKLKTVLSEGPTGLDVENEILIRRDKEAEDDVAPTKAQTAYVLFTSGSTGFPKAVPVTHHNLVPLIEHFSKQFNFTETDRFLQPFELSFDMSVFSMFMAWHHGACLYVVPAGGSKPLDILAMLRDEEITVSALVPTVIDLAGRYLEELELKSLRYTFFAGERLLVSQAKKWAQACQNTRIYNCYGPTEAGILCTMHEYEPATVTSATDVPIGRAFDDTDVILLDEENRVTEHDGELCLSGTQVINAYLNGAGEESFFSLGGKRFYRTGDRVMKDGSGVLHFKGRMDRQLKIRGHRVEPAEIENAVTLLTGTRTAVCAVGAGSAKSLVAFLEGAPEIERVRRQLTERLPAYMVPARMIAMDILPVGINGKLDRQRLVQLYEEQFNT